MKILFLITKSDVGGAQKYVRDLAASLPQEKFQTEIITGGKGGARPVRSRARGGTASPFGTAGAATSNGVRFLSNSFRPYFLFLNDIAAVVEIMLLLRKTQPDILHLNSSKAGVVGAIAAKLYNITHRISHVAFPMSHFPCRPIRVVFTAHGWVFNPENRYGWLRQHLYILFHKLAGLFQDAIINVSEYDRQLALRYNIAPAKKLFTIHNGIDAAGIKFLDKSSAREALLSKLTPLVASGYSLVAKHWIGSIGRLVSEKNYATLIDAAVILKKTISHLPFAICHFIIGDGYERPMLEKKIATLGLQNDVFLLGALPNAEQYLKAFDVFVMPSVKEGLPYTLLEAMAAGLPIIATRTGGMPEILEPNNGIIVPPREPSALANAIKKLLADAALQKTLSANAENCAKHELTLERMTQQTTTIYEHLSNP